MLQIQEEIRRLFTCSIENAKKMIKQNGFIVLQKVLNLPSDNTKLFQNVILFPGGSYFNSISSNFSSKSC